MLSILRISVWLTAFFLASNCYSQVQGVVLESVAYFEDGFEGGLDSIVSGSHVWRLNLITQNEEDQVLAVFGDTTDTMDISTNTSFFISSAFETEYTLVGADQIDPIFFQFWPELEFNTYTMLGEEPGTDQWVGNLQDPTAPWFPAGNPVSAVSINGNIGGGWFHDTSAVPWNDVYGDAEEDLKIPLGQFTTDGVLSGTINVQIYLQGDPMNVQEVTGLIFNSDWVYGCMDPAALNYDSTASAENYQCTYGIVGDLNDDGIIDTADVLIFLGNFGCLSDCGVSDLNGDGVVNISDLLILLSSL